MKIPTPKLMIRVLLVTTLIPATRRQKLLTRKITKPKPNRKETSRMTTANRSYLLYRILFEPTVSTPDREACHEVATR